MAAGTEPLVREVRIMAARETVFAYLTDPSRMTEWFGEGATLDPRPGGIYRVQVSATDTARVGPGQTGRISTGSEPCRLLAIGATPGQAYEAPAVTELGGPVPGAS